MPKKLSKADLERFIEDIEARFLGGATLAEVKDAYRDSDLPISHVTKYRDALFARLRADPSLVRDLANGPILNANRIVRYSGMRRAVKSKLYQSSIFDVLGEPA